MPKGKKPKHGTRTASPAQRAVREAMKEARRRHPKGRIPSGLLQKLISERKRAHGVGGEGAFTDGGGGGARTLARELAAIEQPVVDRTPSRARDPMLGPAYTLKVNRQLRTRVEPDDVLALACAWLYACRLASVGLKDAQDAEYSDTLAKWFGDVERIGIMPRVDLSAEVELFGEVMKALPFAAREMGFTADEWSQSWNAIAGDVTGTTVIAGPGTIVGLDGLWPPVPGATVTDGFHPPAHLGLDLAAAYGTPVRAPEDLLVTAVKTDPEGYGLHVVAVSRNADDGNFPAVTGGGSVASIVPHEGTRRHIFAHLASTAAGLKRGDKVERGQVLGAVGSSGHSTGPHCHWRVDVWIADEEGHVRMTAMDPADLVPLDVLTGSSTVRPPASRWTVIDPKKPEATRDVPSYNIWIGGDLISKGGKVGDIDVLSNPIDAPDEFTTLTAVEKAGKLVGGAIGGFYGGASGSRLGSKAGSNIGRLVGRVGQTILSDE